MADTSSSSRLSSAYDDPPPSDMSSTNDTLVDAATPPPAPAPKIRNIDDLRRLNRKATQEGMYTGVLGGGLLTFIAKRTGVTNKNGLIVGFLLSSTTISFLVTRTIIRNTLGEHYAALRAAQAKTAPGGGTFMGDEAAVGDTGPVPLDERNKKPDPRSQLARELSEIGKPRERTRWAKGHGLDGEVEEEPELQDTYMRPGVPRNV